MSTKDKGEGMSRAGRLRRNVTRVMVTGATLAIVTVAVLTLYAIDIDRAPVRVIRDPYPTFSAVGVDIDGNEIILQDENLFGFLVYDRLTNTPATARFSEPKRIVRGPKTFMEFNCGLYVDQKTGDVYSVNNDTIDTMTVFSRNARGDVSPDRALETPHRTFGIAVDEGTQELFLSVQHPPAVVVYRKLAEGKERPIRILEGDRTGLADPHGLAIDTRRQLMYTANHGSVSFSKGGKSWSLATPEELPGEFERRENMVRGSGKFLPASISVHPLKASGDTAPLRTISGPKTRLNWPSGMTVDEDRNEIFVANDMDDSILVFDASASGDVAPIRVIKGARSGVKNPTGVFIDKKNGELVVANFGNHRATVYPITANGDVPPLRTIRAAPEGKLALSIGNPGAVSYDTKRDQILVPN
jgi:DNA-binding beta-propeller fold protein YncE